MPQCDADEDAPRKVSWDGSNTSGVVPPAGTDRWTVVASNDDGSLLPCAPDLET